MDIPSWKYVSSYVYPVNIVTKKTAYQVIEINMVDGRLYLDSSEANYSFGSLHYVFQQALNRISIPCSKEAKALIVGFGGGSVAQILRAEQYFQGSITGIEIDPVVLELGREYFNLKQFEKVDIKVGEASNIVEELNTRFDIIIVDVFIDKSIPRSCTTERFFRSLLQLLTNNGQIVMNTIPNEINRTCISNWAKVLGEHGTCNSMNITEENKVLTFKKN